MEDLVDVEFTTLMRRKTRQIHNLSDTMVQSKFALSLVNNQVWAEGELVFYEVFKFLERCMENERYTNVVKFFHPDLVRTSCFEADLTYYYGPKWRENNPPRECVRNYISHLKEISESDPNLLIPYIYHLYLGLLSGGRILRKKQKITMFTKCSRVSSVVDIDNETARYLKKFIKETMNEIAFSMSDQMKNELLEESITVFKLNCELIKSINSANDALKWFSIYLCLAVVLAWFTYVYYFSGGKR